MHFWQACIISFLGSDYGDLIKTGCSPWICGIRVYVHSDITIGGVISQNLLIGEIFVCKATWLPTGYFSNSNGLSGDSKRHGLGNQLPWFFFSMLVLPKQNIHDRSFFFSTRWDTAVDTDVWQFHIYVPAYLTRIDVSQSRTVLSRQWSWEQILI